MQTKRREWMIGALVCSLAVMVAGVLPAALAQAPPAGAATPAKPRPVKPEPPKDPMAILKVIPSNASAFVAVRNIAEVDYDVSDVLAKLDLPLEEMGFPGLLAMIKEQAGLAEGLDANSGAAIVLLNCSQVTKPEELENRAVILLPTDKAEALVKAMGGAKENDSYQLTLGSDPAIGVEKNGFLVIASSEAKDALKEVVQAKEGIDKAMSPDRLKAYGEYDIFAWANLQSFSKELRTEPVTALKGMMMMGDPGASADDIDNSMAEINKFLDGVKELSLGAMLDSKVGLKLAFCYRAVPESDIAKRLSAVKAGDKSLLAGLPDEAAILAAGWVNTVREEDMRKLIDQVLKPEVVGEDVDAEQLKSLKDSMVRLATSFEQAAFSISGLPSEGEDGLLGVTVVAKVANSQQTQAEIRKIFGAAKDMLIKAGVKNEALTEDAAKQANEAFQLKENAEKLTGAAVDHFVVDLSKIADMEEEQREQVKSIAGKEGVLIRIAAIGEKNVAITFGGGAKRFAQVVDQVQKNQAPMAERKTIKMVADRLPSQKRLAEAYFSLDRTLATVMDVANKLGTMSPMPIPLTMKETAPLSMVAAQIDPTTVEVDLLVPIELAQSTAEMVKPMMMMFMGGGGPGMMPDEEEKEEAPTPAEPSGVK